MRFVRPAWIVVRKDDKDDKANDPAPADGGKVLLSVRDGSAVVYEKEFVQ